MPHDDADAAARLLYETAASSSDGTARGDVPSVARLERWAAAPASPVLPALSRLLADALGAAWDAGCQAADVRRAVTECRSARHGRLVAAVIAADVKRPEGAGGAGRRLAQLDDLATARRVIEPATVVAAWAETEQLPAAAAVRIGVEVLTALWQLPPEGVLDDAPSAKQLARVRALLAKAESTAFGAEAEACAAKARTLLARHGPGPSTGFNGPVAGPGGRRLQIADPYAAAKALLLSQVAEANGCRSVWSQKFGFSTAFGYAEDLDRVERLFASLLGQAAAAQAAAGAGTDGRRRSRRFRQAFLVAFAVRIGQRLGAVGLAGPPSAGGRRAGLHPVPVRRPAIDDARHAAFPRTTATVLGVGDRAGWVAGTVAADAAALGTLQTRAPSGPEGAHRSAAAQPSLSAASTSSREMPRRNRMASRYGTLRAVSAASRTAGLAL